MCTSAARRPQAHVYVLHLQDGVDRALLLELLGLCANDAGIALSRATYRGASACL